MRKMIDGKMYNTDTAELILTLYNGPRRDQRDYYMTKKGAFFCHYVSVNDMDLVPESTMRVLLASWNPDKYEEIFGEVEEG